MKAKTTPFRRALIYAGLTAASFVMLYPLLWMVSASFKPENEIFTTTSLIPETFTADAYGRGWNGLSVSFGWMFLNSLVISVLAVVGNVISCSMAAYAFTRLQFKGRGFWFAMMLGTMMLPQHAVLIPQYLLFLDFGWVNTILPLVVPKFLAVDAFFIFLMIQFFRAIPRDLDEAALMDGGAPADLLQDHPAAVDAGSGHRRDLFVHLDMGRFLRAADLSERYRKIHRPAWSAHLCRRHRPIGLGRADGHVHADRAADLCPVRAVPAIADRGHRDHRHETLNPTDPRKKANIP